MTTPFISNGRSRLQTTPEYQELRAAVAEKYADRLSRTGWIQRIVLRWQMHRDLRRRLRELEPSPHALWSHQ